jgi:hypothetical protein
MLVADLTMSMIANEEAYCIPSPKKSKFLSSTNMKFKEYFNAVPPKDLHEILTAFDELNGKRI